MSETVFECYECHVYGRSCPAHGLVYATAPRADPAIEVGGAASVRDEPCRQHPTVAHGACVECLRLAREALRLCVEALAAAKVWNKYIVVAKARSGQTGDADNDPEEGAANEKYRAALAAARAVGVEPEDR